MFYMSLLEPDITKKSEIDEDKDVIKLDADKKNQKYKMKRIYDGAIYENKSAKH